jgi:hypothetical protein
LTVQKPSAEKKIGRGEETALSTEPGNKTYGLLTIQTFMPANAGIHDFT